LDEKIAAEANTKLEAEKLAKEETRIAGIIYRCKAKELTELCKIKMAGTTFDKFWVESIQKRFNTLEKLSPIADFMENSETQDDFAEFMSQQLMSESERAKVVVETTTEVDGWTDEELANLAFNVQKYPVGTSSRWDKIHESLGSEKNVKQIQKKVTELAR
jgi:hypothetical protein